MGQLYYIFLMVLSSMIINQDLSFAAKYDVTRLGAFGNGYHDDSKAFLRAWDQACRSNVDAMIVVPHGKTFLLSPLQFKGPCKAPYIHIQIDGTLVGHNDPSEWRGCVDKAWILFSDVDNVEVYGKGKLDGKGSPWWKNVKKSLNLNNDICIRPAVLNFRKCNNIFLKGLTFINPPNNHISLNKCNNLRISRLIMLAPKDSPNTDGIDINSSTNIYIKNSYISSGDDCIAINTGCSNILVQAVTCRNGHGISVGSLGKGGSYATVEDLIVRNCTFTETTNGARIKTWQGGRGYAKNITFEDINLNNAENPIIIDQNYFFKHNNTCSDEKDAVNVSDIKYINIQGTSATMEAIRIECSKHVPCSNIVFENVNIRQSSTIKKVDAICKNANVQSISATYPKIFCS